MKKYIILLLVLIACLSVKAQQKPQYTQYIFNGFLLNPALAGIENYIDLKLGYRNQWQGLDGAPVTSFISINAPLGKEFLYGNANSFGGQGNNPLNRSYKQNYMAAEPHHGVGLQVANDKAGPFSRTDFSASYAYHLGLAAQINLAVGVSAGFSQIKTDGSEIDTGNGETDRALSNIDESQIAPDLGAGVWLYGPAFFAGVSAQQLLSQKLRFSDEASVNEGKLEPHFFATAGYKIFLGEEIAVMPSVMAKYITSVPVSVDLNCKLAFSDKFWIGGGYRNKDSFSGMAGFNIGYFLNLSYSYDFTTSELNTVSNGSHEIVIGFLLNNRYKASCAQRQF